MRLWQKQTCTEAAGRAHELHDLRLLGYVQKLPFVQAEEYLSWRHVHAWGDHKK